LAAIRCSVALVTAFLGILAAVPVGADVAPEAVGQVAELPQPPRPHWAWVSDLILERAALIDLDDGRFLGMINGGYGTIGPLFAARRPEIYVPATYYSRRSHGDRTDTVEIYDAAKLSWLGEVIIPPRRATNAVAFGHQAMSDDDRFVAVFNWTTGTSLSVVDVEHRTLTAEVLTPGCSLAYAAGPRRFFSICADGSLFVVTLDDDGHEVGRLRTQPFFDPRKDPITEKAVRYGNQWLFASFEGVLHPVDVSGAEIAFPPSWPLISDADRAAAWRIGGLQHLAVHERSGHLYSLVHRGGPDSHKDAGEEVWIYNLATRERIQRVKLRSPGLTIYGFPIEFGKTWAWPFNHLCDWILDTFVPPYVSAIQVTQDNAALLFTASQFSGALGVYDAMSGSFLRRVGPTGWTSDILLAPWGGKDRP